MPSRGRAYLTWFLSLLAASVLAGCHELAANSRIQPPERYALGVSENGELIQQVDYLYGNPALTGQPTMVRAGMGVRVLEKGTNAWKVAVPDSAAGAWHSAPGVFEGWIASAGVIRLREGVHIQGEQESKEVMKVEGVLTHYPSDVQSAEAWRGHNFMVGDVPVQPTEGVTEAELKKYVGKKVVVTGPWGFGRAEPSKESLPRPDGAAEEAVRGDGLMVKTIRLVQ